jgi:hypothetical protein
MGNDNNLQLPWKTPQERYQFVRNNLAFSEVVGDAFDFYDAVGRISLNFNYLEDEISKGIIKLINTNLDVGYIIVSELSFKNKLNLLGSLFHYHKSTHTFNSFFPDQEETFTELIKACYKCEEFRNQILHSTFVFQQKQILRSKKTAKATKGLKHSLEKVDSGYILNISDYIYETGANIEEFFMVIERT